MHKLYIGLGSNLGEKEQNINKAIQLIKERIGKVTAQSALISTTPWGYESDNLFLNAVIGCHTELTPMEVLTRIQAIETEMGRVRNKKGYEDRVIDLDILLYDDLIIQTQALTIPHPFLDTRLFVLEPLAQIDPEFIHPILNKTIKKLVEERRA